MKTMSDLMHREQAYPPSIVSGAADVQGEPAKGNMALRVLRSLRRHWRLALLLWIVTSAPAVAFVRLQIKPKYTASADVKIEPEKQLLPQDVAPPSFEGFFNTQPQIISSAPVLQDALRDPDVKGLAILLAEDPVVALEESINVTRIGTSWILRVKVRQKDRDAAIRLTRAVMKAYDANARSSETGNREKDINRFTIYSEGLKKEKEALEKKHLELSQSQSSASVEVHDKYQESTFTIVASLRVQRAQAQSRRIQLHGELAQLEKGLVPTTSPAEDFNWIEQQVEKDPMVLQIRSEQAKVAGEILTRGLSRPYEEKRRKLEDQLAKEQDRARQEANVRLQGRQKSILEDEKRRVQGQLKAAESEVAYLDEELRKAEEQGKQAGGVSIQIKRVLDEIKALDKEIESVDQKLKRLEFLNRGAGHITVDTNPRILADGVEDPRMKLMLAAVMGGLFGSIFLVFMRDFLSGRLYSTDDMEDNGGLCLLGELPSLDDLRHRRITEDDFRENYRAIRATLAGRTPDGRIPRAILVTSGQAAEGKTSLAVSLAASLAEGGCRVLLIDGDVQAPRIDRTLRLSHRYSLRHVLLGERQLAEAVVPTPVPGLEVLLGGRNGESASGVLTSRLAAQMLDMAGERYDHVVIDSPPALGSADALIWAQAADGVILSSFAGHSSLRIIRRVQQRIAAVSGNILGIVICNVSFRESYSSYSRSCSRSTTVDEGSEAEGFPAYNDAARIPLAGRMLTSSNQGVVQDGGEPPKRAAAEKRGARDRRTN